MMVSSVAVQGSGTGSASWLLSVGNRASVLAGLAEVLVTRLPVKQRRCRFQDEFTLSVFYMGWVGVKVKHGNKPG